MLVEFVLMKVLGGYKSASGAMRHLNYDAVLSQGGVTS